MCVCVCMCVCLCVCKFRQQVRFGRLILEGEGIADFVHICRTPIISHLSQTEGWMEREKRTRGRDSRQMKSALVLPEGRYARMR